MKFLFVLPMLFVAMAQAKSVDPKELQALAWAFPTLSYETVLAVGETMADELMTKNVTTATYGVGKWTCPELPAAPAATKVSDLHPRDIGAMGAIGDSITTGCNAASTSLLGMKDYQGLSWIMGGDGFGTDSETTTLGNIISHYGHPVMGRATGTGSAMTGFNHAKNGAVAQNLEGQAKKLIANWKTTLGKDYATTWKLANVFIGGNNLCKSCSGGVSTEAGLVENFMAGVEDSLKLLRTVPRLFVALPLLPDITQLAKFKNGIGCRMALAAVCPCASSDDENKKRAVRELGETYNAALRKLPARFPNTNDWALVLQNSLDHVDIPNGDYLSKADCFHPSASGQALFATALWNTLVSKDKKGWKEGDVVKCLTEDSRLWL